MVSHNNISCKIEVKLDIEVKRMILLDITHQTLNLGFTHNILNKMSSFF